VTGSISHGQGHATVQTQILVDRLGVDPHSVKFIQGDTDAVAFGMGTGGSRSTTMSGGAIVLVSEKIIAKGKKLAAHLLEASEADMEFKDGRVTIAGTDRALGIHEIGKTAFQLDKLPPGMEPSLYETATYRARAGNFPNGCHICEVEIDRANHTRFGLKSADNPLTYNGRDCAWFEVKPLILGIKNMTLNQRVQGSSPCAPTH
jgi:aerobic carbon-monoxide dehydrogenase large subunit